MFLALIIFILIFSFLVLSHEFGHFITAKKLGVKVEEFGIGFPPKAYGKKIGETLYSINWIPFGGFVRLLGEDPGKTDSKEPCSFDNKPPKIKSVILLAGVTVNILVAVFLFYILLGFNNFQTFQTQLFDYQFPAGEQRVYYPAVSKVIEGSPAEKAGIQEFDLILSGNDTELHDSKKLINFLQTHAGEEISLTILGFDSGDQLIKFLESNAKEETFLTAEILYTHNKKIVTVIPRQDPPEGEGSIGIGITSINRLSYNTPAERVFSGFLHSYNMSHFTFAVLGRLVRTSVAERDIRPVSEAVAGPVGILAFTKLSMEGGFWQILTLAAVLSLALAIMNLLPIPAADGGRMVFVLYEAIFRKRASAKLERRVNLIGFYLLLALFVLITIKDIKQFKDILF
jgi:regulator of sigma E protease